VQARRSEPNQALELPLSLDLPLVMEEMSRLLAGSGGNLATVSVRRKSTESLKYETSSLAKIINHLGFEAVYHHVRRAFIS
jgi:hypothetical protein